MVPIEPGIAGLIFDCDGTLADTMPLHWRAWYEVLAEFGAVPPHGALEEMSGIPTPGIVRLLNQKFGWNINVEEFSKKKEARAFELLDAATPIEPVVQTARWAHGKMPLAVVSGGCRADVEKTLNAIGLAGHFDCVLTADDGLPPKPSPEIFLEAARRIRVLPRLCQVFEDGNPGILGARHAGMVVTDVRLLLPQFEHGAPPRRNVSARQ